MGNARAAGIDAAVYVDPKRYYETPYVEKPLVASAVGAAADALAAQGATMLLLAPGRIGTSSPELGVPVTFADIEHFEGVCEMAYSGAGYSPELSYGSHMFQDLVEANIYYGAIAERDGRLGVNVRLLEGFDEMSLPDQVSNPNGAVSVYLTGARKLTLWHDALENRSVCGLAD